MKQQVHRLFPFLALILLLSACGDQKETTVGSDTADTKTVTQTDGTQDENAQYDPQIPSADYGGRTFTFLYGDNEYHLNRDVSADSYNSEPLNDAIYERNLAINQKYNIEIKWTRFDGFGDASKELSKMVKAGESAYDVNINNAAYSFKLAAEGCLYELNDFPYIDFTKPYWNSDMLAGSSVNGKNYYAYSDMNIFALSNTPCVLFNKTVAGRYQIPDLYEIVENGEWTFDVMSQLIKEVTEDTNGDGKVSVDDTLGFIANDFCAECFLSGTGYQTIIKDADDMPVLNVQTEAYYNIIEAIQNLCAEENGSFICDRYSDVDREQAPIDALQENRALFWMSNLDSAEGMRNMDSDFGILPVPKLNAEQEQYYVHFQKNIGGATSIPSNASDPELCGMVLEDMAYMSMVSVKPVYMNVLLEGKVARDNESVVSLNIIFNSYYSDLGFMTSESNIDMLDDLRDYMCDNSRDYVSKIEKKIAKYQKNLEKICDKFLEENY